MRDLNPGMTWGLKLMIKFCLRLKDPLRKRRVSVGNILLSVFILLFWWKRVRVMERKMDKRRGPKKWSFLDELSFRETHFG